MPSVHPHTRRLSRTPQHRFTPEPQDRLEQIPYTRLAAAVLIQAALDWRAYGHITEPFLCGANTKEQKEMVRMDLVALDNAYRGPREELLAFFDGDAYPLYCELAGINPEIFRRKLGIPD